MKIKNKLYLLLSILCMYLSFCPHASSIYNKAESLGPICFSLDISNDTFPCLLNIPLDTQITSDAYPELWAALNAELAKSHKPIFDYETQKYYQRQVKNFIYSGTGSYDDYKFVFTKDNEFYGACLGFGSSLRLEPKLIIMKLTHFPFSLEIEHSQLFDAMTRPNIECHDVWPKYTSDIKKLLIKLLTNPIESIKVIIHTKPICSLSIYNKQCEKVVSNLCARFKQENQEPELILELIRSFVPNIGIGIEVTEIMPSDIEMICDIICGKLAATSQTQNVLVPYDEARFLYILNYPYMRNQLPQLKHTIVSTIKDELIKKTCIVSDSGVELASFNVPLKLIKLLTRDPVASPFTNKGLYDFILSQIPQYNSANRLEKSTDGMWQAVRKNQFKLKELINSISSDQPIYLDSHIHNPMSLGFRFKRNGDELSFEDLNLTIEAKNISELITVDSEGVGYTYKESPQCISPTDFHISFYGNSFVIYANEFKKIIKDDVINLADLIYRISIHMDQLHSSYDKTLYSSYDETLYDLSESQINEIKANLIKSKNL